MRVTFDVLAPDLDPGIREAVRLLMSAGIETFESCQGGEGHAYSRPTVRFHGHRDEGFRALAVALANGFRVVSLCRVWDIIDGEPTGPHWELEFASRPAILQGGTIDESGATGHS